MALVASLGHPQYPIFEKCGPKYHVSGLFSDKSAATVFNNNIELFEKTKGQGPRVFRLLGFRFLGYERPPETLK